MKIKSKLLAGSLALCLAAACLPSVSPSGFAGSANAAGETVSMEWGTLEIGGGGFVSGIVTGQNEMYLRTDVGGAYKYNYEKGEWEQLLDFLGEADRGLLSVSGIAIDPTDDDTFYMLCGCAYFSDAKTVIFKTTDGGETFTEYDVSDMIQCHANGDGRECSEPIAVDPDNPNIIYAGGDVAAGDSCLIKSTDAGKTWKSVEGYDDLGMYKNNVKWPEWTSHIARGTLSGQYNTQNGVASIHIEGGKVYVGTSITGQTNIHVADVDTDKFTPLSSDLPTANYPVTISSDNNGNIFCTYIAGLAFSGSAGGAYKYNIASGKVTDISPSGNAIGMITADKDDPNLLVARTCGLWSDQWYEKEWTDNSIAWGDYFFRSTDGGASWTNITPGQQKGQYTDDHYFVSEPIDTNGYDWIYGKACHWGSGILIDPRNSDRVLLTSGNGVFACDNVWAERGVQFYFQPKGIEEVVALDFASSTNGKNYSAIGDYDGYIHSDKDEIGLQYKPNIGSTSAISYCPQNPDVMMRVGENEAKAFYSLDAGSSWTEMKVPNGGGKTAIAQIGADKYRFFKTSKDNAAVQYSDDFGGTWNNCAGIKGSKPSFVVVEPNDPSTVYAYSAVYNPYWSSDPSKTEPTFEDAHYVLMVSKDGGKNFTATDVCRYDECDIANRIGYLGEGEMVLGAGWYGAYRVSGGGESITKLDSVFYCKTIGYGAPEKEGGLNTLYMYGKPAEDDAEGIYRSTDGGETWICINTDKLYGGTGNGNFLVGDMNEFGTVYMSTVGCGIVYGMLSSGSTEPTTKPADDIVWGDANCDGKILIDDVVLIMSFAANPVGTEITAQGLINSDVYQNGDGVQASDAASVQKYLTKVIAALPES